MPAKKNPSTSTTQAATLVPVTSAPDLRQVPTAVAERFLLLVRQHFEAEPTILVDCHVFLYTQYLFARADRPLAAALVQLLHVTSPPPLPLAAHLLAFIEDRPRVPGLIMPHPRHPLTLERLSAFATSLLLTAYQA